MKIKIEEFCIRCGICVHYYPELYEMDYEEDAIRIKVNDVPEELAVKAKESIRDCAVTAIRLEK